MLLKDPGRAGRGQGGLYPGQGVIWRERHPGPTGLLCRQERGEGDGPLVQPRGDHRPLGGEGPGEGPGGALQATMAPRLIPEDRRPVVGVFDGHAVYGPGAEALNQARAEALNGGLAEQIFRPGEREAQDPVVLPHRQGEAGGPGGRGPPRRPHPKGPAGGAEARESREGEARRGAQARLIEGGARGRAGGEALVNGAAQGLHAPTGGQNERGCVGEAANHGL
jgi:hypothetical protein